LLKALYNGWNQKDATIVMKIYQQLSERPGETKKTPAKNISKR
jgi:hypothetical protein